MKRFVKLLVLGLALTAFTGCGVAKLKDLSVSSLGVKYLAPTSNRSLSAVLLLGLDNPSIDFTVSDVEGVVRYYDREILTFTAGELPEPLVFEFGRFGIGFAGHRLEEIPRRDDHRCQAGCPPEKWHGPSADIQEN